jgi:hypothetical protein
MLGRLLQIDPIPRDKVSQFHADFFEVFFARLFFR